MISVEEARSRILAYFYQIEPETRPLLDALGQTLAEDITATFNIPPLTNTAMDGYAVRAADTTGASEAEPVVLRVTGEVAAGYIYDGEVESGSAVRIMTGAPIPEGADAVVPFEETDETGMQAPHAAGRLNGRVQVFKPAALGANLREAGEDIAAGQRVMDRGTLLGASQLGVIASVGRDRVTVTRRPRVAVLSTGDELLQPGEARRPGKIYDSNLTSLSALITEFGGVPVPLGVARDNVEDLTTKIRQALDTDMVVTSAGVSRGDFDIVKLVLAREGDVDFWTVNMRPGKPLAFGGLRAGSRLVPHIGLPGNPVSSMIAFEIFGRPAIFTMLGRRDWERPRIRATTSDRISMVDGRRFYARCVISRRNGGYDAVLTGSQGSGILSGLARANGLAVVPEGHPDVEAGGEVDVMLLGAPSVGA
ncbi:MAG TPA: gephyrin-like molybdotransferase Glp [Dehalococcoidia bacterium]|nr:gephyrin-like molybdotransferase Glp [Dehalococcoidia bacterium]